MASKAHIVVDVLNCAEALYLIRHEIAEFTRRVAGAEPDPRVARRLREIAAAFEAGQAKTEA